MKNFGDKITRWYFQLPKWAEFIIAWTVIIGLIFGFLWLNDNYIHLPISGDNECTGTFEYNCGSSEDMRVSN